jgi:hypothetical protein
MRRARWHAETQAKDLHSTGSDSIKSAREHTLDNAAIPPFSLQLCE